MGALGVEAGGELVEDGVDVIHVEFGTEFVEDLDEAAHVGAFEVVGEVDGEGNGGDGVLRFARFVANLHGVAEGADPDAIDGDLAVVGFVLGIFEWSGVGRRNGHKG